MQTYIGYCEVDMRGEGIGKVQERQFKYRSESGRSFIKNDLEGKDWTIESENVWMECL